MYKTKQRHSWTSAANQPGILPQVMVNGETSNHATDLRHSHSTELTATLLPLILSNTRTTNASHRHYPSYTPTRTTSIFPTRDALLTYERALILERQIEDALANESRFEGAQEALILFKPAHRRWSELLDELEHPDDNSDLATARPGALERFHEGHVLTRVVYKGAFACGITKRYYEEEQILRSLLSQDRWRKGRRGWE